MRNIMESYLPMQRLFTYNDERDLLRAVHEAARKDLLGPFLIRIPIRNGKRVGRLRVLANSDYDFKTAAAYFREYHRIKEQPSGVAFIEHVIKLRAALAKRFQREIQSMTVPEIKALNGVMQTKESTKRWYILSYTVRAELLRVLAAERNLKYEEPEDDDRTTPEGNQRKMRHHNCRAEEETPQCAKEKRDSARSTRRSGTVGCGSATCEWPQS